MKKLVYLFLLAGIVTGQAQIIQLDEARVNARAVKIIANGEDLKYVVLEDYSGQFLKNPIAFMKENFDIHPLIKQLKEKNYVSYLVEFRNSRGYLEAHFDRKGKLISTAQKFRDIPLPLSVSRELVTNHKGWTMKKSLYLASGKGDAVDKELYRITLKNGNSTQNVKIIPASPSRGLASN